MIRQQISRGSVMERCNLQAMLKLVKLCEPCSTNRLRGFDFTARLLAELCRLLL